MRKPTPAQARLLRHLADGTWPEKQGGIWETMGAVKKYGWAEWVPVPGKPGTSKLTLTEKGWKQVNANDGGTSEKR